MRGTGETVYRHERRQHGLSAGNRILIAAAANLPPPRQGCDAALPRYYGPRNREEADLSSHGNDTREPVMEQGEDSDQGSHQEEVIDEDSDEESELENGPIYEQDEEYVRRRLHAQLLEELRDEIREFLFELEIVRNIPACIVDEVAAKLHVFATYGANMLPETNLFREVFLREGYLTRWRRKKLYHGRFGESCAQLRYVPGERHQRPQIYFKGLKTHLTSLMAIPEVVACLTGGVNGGQRPWYESHSDVVHNFKSSDRFLAIREFLGQEYIGVRVYGDGFSLNTIGAHRLDKNEYYGIYVQLAHMPAHLSRKVASWSTIAVAEMINVQDISQIWSLVTSELKTLFEVGFYVQEVDRTYPVVLVNYCGDLKDKNSVCAIAPPGTSTYPHATSLVDSRTRRAACQFEDVNPLSQLRSREGLEKDIVVYQRTGDLIKSRGVSGRSVLDECADFLAEGFLTPDVSHTFYLGVYQADMCLVLSLFNARGHIAQEEITGKLAQFKEKVLTGPEKANFVCNLLGQRSTGDTIKLNLKGSISQLRLMCKYCTVIFSDLRGKCSSPVEETAWEVMASLQNLSCYLDSFALSKRQICEFQGLLEEYTNLRLRLRDQVQATCKERFDLLPKHVDLLSAASAYKNSGSLLLTSTTTMESKNGLIKALVQGSRNRINCVKTIGGKIELMEKWGMTKLFQRAETQASKWGLKSMRETLTAEQFHEIQLMSRQVDICQKINHKGRDIFAGNVVEVYFSAECLTTETIRILAFAVSRAEEVTILAEDIVTCHLKDFNLYGIARCRRNVRVVKLEELCSPYANVVMKKNIMGFEYVFTKGVIAPLL